MAHLEPHRVHQNVGDRHRTAGNDVGPDPGLLQNSGNRPVRLLKRLYEPFGHPADGVLIDGTDFGYGLLVDLVFNRDQEGLKPSLSTIEAEPAVLASGHVAIDP